MKYYLTYYDERGKHHCDEFTTREGMMRAAGFASFAGHTHIRMWCGNAEIL